MKALYPLLVLLAVAAMADDTPATDELVRRSGLPASEVTTLLAACDGDQANQASINLCAWRDQLAAERELQRVVDAKTAARPACEPILARKLAKWRPRRDRICRQAAARQWGGGSMLPAAQAICATAETQRMSKRIDAHSCR